MGSIFDKGQLVPRQMRAVAERRFADACALRDTGRNQHANGAMYLGGFVIEILLKAKLIETRAWLRSAAMPANRSAGDRRLWNLCYRSRDLQAILDRLPEVRTRLAALRIQLLHWVHGICSQWTVFARYSPQSATKAMATEFLARIKELKKWLK